MPKNYRIQDHYSCINIFRIYFFDGWKIFALRWVRSQNLLVTTLSCCPFTGSRCSSLKAFKTLNKITILINVKQKQSTCVILMSGWICLLEKIWEHYNFFFFFSNYEKWANNYLSVNKLLINFRWTNWFAVNWSQ